MSSEYSIERGFISKLVETHDMKLVTDQRVKPSYFTGDNRRVFEYIMRQYASTGDIPTPRVIARKFQGFSLEYHEVEGVETVGTDESLNFWCDELRRKTRHNMTADAVEDVTDLLNEGKSEEALELLKARAWKISSETSLTASTDIRDNPEQQWEIYQKRKETRGMDGITTGIPLLDYILKGWAKETLTSFIATTGTGKTWLLVLFACVAMKEGYKPVLFTTEMPEQQIRDRINAVLYGLLYGSDRGDFSYSAFKSGRLSPEVEEAYHTFLVRDLPHMPPFLIETAEGISSVISVIESESPDIVLIDGVYLMQDEQGAESDWLRIAHITRDVKAVCKKYKIPILVTTQADKNTSKRTGPELGDISYTQAVGQDSDNILGMFQDAVMVQDREMTIKVLKQREGERGSVTINWDFDTMNFTAIYSENADGQTNAVGDKVMGVDDEEVE